VRFKFMKFNHTHVVLTVKLDSRSSSAIVKLPDPVRRSRATEELGVKVDVCPLSVGVDDPRAYALAEGVSK